MYALPEAPVYCSRCRYHTRLPMAAEHQWRYHQTNIANGGVYGGATTTTLTLTNITAGMTGSQYRCVVSGAAPCAAVNSGVATFECNTATSDHGCPYTALMAGWTTTLTVNVTPAPDSVCLVPERNTQAETAILYRQCEQTG